MMNIRKYRFVVALLWVAIGIHPLWAQSDPAAAALLKQVSAKYATYQTIQADFTLGIQQANQGAPYQQTGSLSMESKTGKFHIVMDGQVMISDGKAQWTILEDEEEVQIVDANADPDGISPTTIFSFYNKGYKYVSAADEKSGAAALSVVELSPEDTRKPYFKIKLRINKSSKLIHDVTIFDKNGSRYTYAIQNLRANQPISADKFTFDKRKYPGLEVVDLR